jgi:hypothetical protein
MGKLYRNQNILETDVEDLWDFQGGICPICNQNIFKEGTGMERPCVDHDHATGAIRGIIHSRCNIMLGYAQDSIETLETAIRYLKNTPASIFFSREEI